MNPAQLVWDQQRHRQGEGGAGDRQSDQVKSFSSFSVVNLMTKHFSSKKVPILDIEIEISI
jgi:hypothetical protein